LATIDDRSETYLIPAFDYFTISGANKTINKVDPIKAMKKRRSRVILILLRSTFISPVYKIVLLFSTIYLTISWLFGSQVVWVFYSQCIYK